MTCCIELKGITVLYYYRSGNTKKFENCHKNCTYVLRDWHGSTFGSGGSCWTKLLYTCSCPAWRPNKFWCTVWYWHAFPIMMVSLYL